MIGFNRVVDDFDEKILVLKASKVKCLLIPYEGMESTNLVQFFILQLFEDCLC